MSVDQIVRLTPDADLAGLRERLAHIQEQMVILVVPNNAPLLRRAVNARLLRRYADQMNLSVHVVTRDRASEAALRGVGLPVHHALSSVPLKRSGALTRADLKETPGLPPVRWYRRLFSLGLWLIALAFLAAGAAAVTLAGVIVAPTASIRLAPATDTMTVVLDLTASSQIRVLDSDVGEIPARPVQVLIEDTGQVQTTGSKPAPDQPAKGTVVFANRSMAAVTIPVSTTVRTATGVSLRFRTEEEATLPAGSLATVRVPVKAVDPGSTGNIKAGAINIVEGGLSFQVSVINDEEMKGGSEKQARYATLQDRNSLRDAVLQKIRARSYSELSKAIGPRDVLPEQTLTVSINETSFDKPLEGIGDYLTGKVRATVSGLVLDDDDLGKVVTARLAEMERPGFRMLLDDIAYGAPSKVSYTDGVVSLQLTATARSQAQISSRDVQRLAAGKDASAVAAEIARRYNLAHAPAIALQQNLCARLPDAVQARLCGRMPLFLSRITVTIDTGT